MPITENTLNFLTEYRRQNSKNWFHENRPGYMNDVLEPLMELVEALTPVMLEIDPHFETNTKVGKTISRIYRDTRFFRDKSLYRDVMWFPASENRQGKPSRIFSGNFSLSFSQRLRLLSGQHGKNAVASGKNSGRQPLVPAHPIRVHQPVCFRNGRGNIQENPLS